MSMNLRDNARLSPSTAASNGRAKFAALLSLSVVVLAKPSLAQEPAAQDPKAVCAQSFEQAQRHRNESHYVAANQEVLKCANPACGEALFQECTKLYTELQGAIPSVVFGARDRNGNELTDVRVSVDGQPFAEQLDGKPVQLDPGSHTFLFSSSDYPPVERQAVIRAGERFRPVVVTLDKPEAAPVAAPQPASTGAQTTPPPPENSGPRTIPITSYVLGGVGIAAVGVGVWMRVQGKADYDELKDNCAPTCPNSDVDTVKREYLISNVAFGVGAAALIGAVATYFALPRSSSAETAFTVAPTRGGGFAQFTKSF